MKHIITFFIGILLFSSVKSQCKDLYGVKSDCPNEQDSLLVYNNAIKIFDFYENHKGYQKIRTKQLTSISDRKNVFDDLATARRMFSIIRREVAAMSAKTKKSKPSNYKDITFGEYYQEVDEYRFYQRELENQIVNKAAPMTLYDVRIGPILVNEYKCLDSTDSHFGDLVNLPLYVPVTVKPYTLLTEDEVRMRNEILKLIDVDYQPIVINKQYLKLDTSTNRVGISKVMIVDSSKKVITITKNNIEIQPILSYPCSSGVPVYAYSDITGTIVGFVCDRYFIKIKPNEYNQYAVPKWAQEILENEKNLKTLIKRKFGDGYIIKII